MRDRPYIIVGAGVSGLTLAYTLVSAGKKVVVIERDAKVGGLARSFTYHHSGQKSIFDIGPKRFHTDDTEVLQFIKEILPHELLTIGRDSSVYFLGKYFHWPITPVDLLQLPLTIQLRIGMDVLKKLIPQKQSDSVNFTEEIMSKYGPTLYQSFFAGYTEKFTRIPAHLVHKDWATTGVNRSIIDPKAKGNSIWELIYAVVLPKTVDTKFLYPKNGGFGHFTDTLAKRIRNMGGTILTGTTITKLDYPDKKVTLTDGKTISFDTLIWSGNLHALASLLSRTFDHIQYLSTIFYQLTVQHMTSRSDQWIYYADTDISFVRATLPKNLARYTTPHGYSTIMLEVTCTQGDDRWNNPSALLPKIYEDLIKTGLIPHKQSIVSTHIQRIADTYPVYHLDYAKGFAKASHTIHSQFPDIRLLGRSGTFWYNNSDHSMKAALGMAKYLLGKTKTLPDKDTIFSKESVSHT
jgi:protoporphyrinogen oxidase